MRPRIIYFDCDLNFSFLSASWRFLSISAGVHCRTGTLPWTGGAFEFEVGCPACDVRTGPDECLFKLADELIAPCISWLNEGATLFEGRDACCLATGCFGRFAAGAKLFLGATDENPVWFDEGAELLLLTRDEEADLFLFASDRAPC